MESIALKPFRFGIVILAAGFSRRMGEPKLLLPWGKHSVLEHIISVWRGLGAAQLTVVCAPPSHPVHGELDRLRFPEALRLLNSVPEQGMFSSIQCAARWNGWRPELTHVAFVLGDQPQITQPTLRSLLDHAAAHPGEITQPAFYGRPKHPVILPRKAFISLARTGAGNLREFLENGAFPRRFVECPDESLTIDLDRPEDYRAALARFAPETSVLAASMQKTNDAHMTSECNAVGWFEIYVDDMARAQRFYEAVFDLQLQTLDSPVIQMLAFPMKHNASGCPGALVKMPGQGRPSGNAVIIYFSCEDCAVEAARAAKSGGKIFKEKFSIGQYGFISLVHDTEGNMIGLHSRQ